MSHDGSSGIYCKAIISRFRAALVDNQFRINQPEVSGVLTGRDKGLPVVIGVLVKIALSLAPSCGHVRLATLVWLKTHNTVVDTAQMHFLVDITE